MPAMHDANSHVNFESGWDDFPQPINKEKPTTKPLFLQESRQRKFYFDRRSLPQIVEKISRKRILRKIRKQKHALPAKMSLRSPRQEIVADLGGAIASLTFTEARQVLQLCDKRAEQLLLGGAISLLLIGRRHHWAKS